MSHPSRHSGRPRFRGWALTSSSLLHLAALAVLALVFVIPRSRPPVVPTLIGIVTTNQEASLERLEFQAAVDAAELPWNADPGAVASEVQTDVEPSVETVAPPVLIDPQATRRKVEDPLPTRHPVARTSAVPAGGFSGRWPHERARLLAARGGTEASEVAVAAGLAWLAAHQFPDGGWRFDHRDGPCQGRCAHAGSATSVTGATALALLPFLGAGHTPRDGQYADVVARGVRFLVAQLRFAPQGGDLRDGTMYAQGLAAIALAEAAAMASDEALRAPAQAALDFIVHTQHPHGGWRYFPGQPGDMTVTGWQLVALQSGRTAGLRVPDEAFDRAVEFLGSTSKSSGRATDRNWSSKRASSAFRPASRRRRFARRKNRGAAKTTFSAPPSPARRCHR